MKVNASAGSLDDPGRRSLAAPSQLLLSGFINVLSPLTTAPSVRDFETQLRDHVRKDQEHEARAAETRAPTRSADVTTRAERDMERSSRAFRRQAHRGQAAEQFRTARHAFRDAMQQRGARPPVNATGRQELPPAGQTETASRTEKAPAASDAKTPHTDKAQPAPRPAPSTQGRPPATKASDGGANTTAPPAAAARQDAPGRAAEAIELTRARAGSRPNLVGPRTAIAGKGASAAKPAHPITSGAPRGAERPAASMRTGKARGADSAQRSANIDQIVKVLRRRLSDNLARVVMRLNPAELGKIRLEMNLRGDALELKIDTQTDLAHRLLLEDAETLRRALETAGIQLERLEIHPPQRGSDGSDPAHATPADTPSAERDASADADEDAEHPDQQGTEPPPAVSSVDGDERGASSEPEAESRVNVLA